MYTALGRKHLRPLLRWIGHRIFKPAVGGSSPPGGVRDRCCGGADEEGVLRVGVADAAQCVPVRDHPVAVVVFTTDRQGIARRVVAEEAGQAGAEEVKAASWIKQHAVTNRQLVRVLQQDLDAGEAEANALSLEIESELLLMDERLGRATASHLGLRYTGLIGVLIEAKHKGLLPSVKSPLDRLRDVAGFRVREALYQRVLKDEGEV